ncbi:MAG: hypothetical protein KDK04_20325 [Candidatus Competibacteraceae bacterium]|nr:hypothetical protein [Candidatus Competibacteraceae bacterium]
MSKFDRINIGLNIPDLHSSIQIALANISVLERHIESSYLSKPVVSRSRLTPFTKLLNEISCYRTSSKKKIDLVIFPEVSIPHAWEQMLVKWARKHNIGVVCGLEHRIDRKGFAYNEVLAALPYKARNNHIACFPYKRLKRHYSPGEIFVLENERLKIPDLSRDEYQLFRWRGCSFAIYNCFELASIEDRCLFKGKVDFIIGTEFNRDVSYFSNIVESASRDLHCYVIQVNDSRYGDSRVVSPSKAEKMNPLRIKGGENLTFLTISLNLKALREHQRKLYGLQKDSANFKPTPPGLDIRDVQERIRLGNQ